MTCLWGFRLWHKVAVCCCSTPDLNQMNEVTMQKNLSEHSVLPEEIYSLSLNSQTKYFRSWGAINDGLLLHCFSLLSLSFSLSLTCLLLHPVSLSLTFALQSFLWKCQWTVVVGPKNTCPLTMVTCLSASYLIYLSLLFWLIFISPISFSLRYVILIWLCQQLYMTHVSLLKVTKLVSKTTWL